MHHHPEFPEPSSSSSEAIQPDRQQEISRSTSTPSESETSGSYHEASEPATAWPTELSQVSTKRQSPWRASYPAIASAIIAALLIGGLAGWLLGNVSPKAQGLERGSPAPQAQVEQVAEKFHTSVVQINVQ